jgi:voltage-gated potassium channel
MKQLLLSIALALRASKRYKKTKSFVRGLLLEYPSNKYKKYLDITIIFLVVSSVAILIYEVKDALPEWLDLYDIYFVSFVFFLEYLLRLWIHNDLGELIIDEYHESQFLQREFNPFLALGIGIKEKLKYMITPYAIIDLLAIFPAYRPLRVLRVFVLFRIFKLLRYTRSINQFVEVLVNKKFELLTLLFLLLFIVFTSGIAFYVLEQSTNPNIDSLFDAIYWALITISTVGYGDISPVSPEARVVSMFIIIAGIAMISFATSIIVSAFSERLLTLKEHRIIEKINKNSSFLVICGYGQMTKMFIAQRQNTLKNYVILDKDISRVKSAIKDGYNAINEDASSFEVMSQFNVDNAKVTVLCLTSSDVENIYITLNVKSISRKINVIARVNDTDMISKYTYAGANSLVKPNSVVNTMVHSAITQPTMYKAVHAILTGKSISRVDEIHVYDHNIVIGKSVKEIDFREHKLLFIGIQRDGEFMFNPPENEKIKHHDVLIIMGRQISIDYFIEKHFGVA